MAGTKYDADTKALALEVYARDGSTAAAEASGVPANTIRSWAKRGGVRSSSDSRRERVEAAQLTLAERRANLASALLDDADRLRRQLFAEALRVHYDGGEHGVGWTDYTLPQPTNADQLAILKALDVAVRNVQLLTGEATERVEGMDLEAELNAYQQGLADRAATEAPAP